MNAQPLGHRPQRCSVPGSSAESSRRSAGWAQGQTLRFQRPQLESGAKPGCAGLLLSSRRGLAVPGGARGSVRLRRKGCVHADLSQVSAGGDGRERSFQDPSCQESSQNLPCFSLSMW